MPKFGQVHFGKNYFGDSTPSTANWKRSFAGIPLGLWVRRQIAKQVIFRVRRGNGHRGAILGKAYQDKYKYFVPASINNAASEPYRIQWAAAIDYWQNILTTEEKQAYNERATHGFHMSGYNLFIREAMKGEIEMFVNRGDPASFDFTVANFTTDNTWRELNLSAIIPTTARAVLLELNPATSASGKEFIFRSYGNTNTINHTGVVTKITPGIQHKTCIVAVDANRKIEYKAVVATWNTLDLVVRGWWT